MSTWEEKFNELQSQHESIQNQHESLQDKFNSMQNQYESKQNQLKDEFSSLRSQYESKLTSLQKELEQSKLDKGTTPDQIVHGISYYLVHIQQYFTLKILLHCYRCRFLGRYTISIKI